MMVPPVVGGSECSLAQLVPVTFRENAGQVGLGHQAIGEGINRQWGQLRTKCHLHKRGVNCQCKISLVRLQ